MEAITLKSGHTLELGTPDFSTAKKLFKTLARELREVDIDLEGLDLSTLEGLDHGIIVKAFFQVAQSDAVEAAVMECATRSMLQGNKIVPASFENVDMRQDYLSVAWEVMKMTLSPFFAGLSFPSSTPAKPSPSAQG
jgi:hypothetical protein